MLDEMKILRPSDEDQIAVRESAEDEGKLPVTVLHGTHSCSIHCFGSTQQLADEQAEYILNLQKDAERYRWLRQQHWAEAEIGCVMNPKTAIKLGQYCPSLERLDEIIDRAKQKSEET